MRRNAAMCFAVGRKGYWLSFDDIVAILKNVSKASDVETKIELMPTSDVRMLLRHEKVTAAAMDYLCKNGRL